MQKQTDGVNTPAPGVPDAKLLATLQAKAALMGYAVHHLPDGAYLVCRWNLSRELPDTAALTRWLEQVGVR